MDRLQGELSTTKNTVLGQATRLQIFYRGLLKARPDAGPDRRGSQREGSFATRQDDCNQIVYTTYLGRYALSLEDMVKLD